MSGETRDRLNGAVAVRAIGPVTLRGKEHPVGLFELVDE